MAYHIQNQRERTQILREGRRLLKILKLPCVLRFATYGRWKNPNVHACHIQIIGKDCCILINPNIEIFTTPIACAQHVVLHEASHHVTSCKCQDKHCKHWATNLVGLYKKTSTTLPHNSSVPSFAILLH